MPQSSSDFEQNHLNKRYFTDMLLSPKSGCGISECERHLTSTRLTSPISSDREYCSLEPVILQEVDLSGHGPTGIPELKTEPDILTTEELAFIEDKLGEIDFFIQIKKA